MRVSNYSDYLTQVSSAIGVEEDTLQDTELTFLNAYFNKAIRKIWESNSWTELSTQGEARFPGNFLSYQSDYTQSSAWSLLGLTATANITQNPLDSRINAGTLLESSFTGGHRYAQTIAQVLPNTPYQFSGYVRPFGRNYIVVVVSDGQYSYQANYNLTPGSSGIISTSTGSTTSSLTANVSLQGNGFYLWTLTFTSGILATGGSVSIYLSPDGTTVSYPGVTSLGIYAWGTTGSIQQNLNPSNSLIPFTLPGETDIDVMFNVTAQNPGATMYPTRANYEITPYGFQLIGAYTTGPVYIYYRPRRPLYNGATWSDSAIYVLGTTIYFTNSSGVGNYFCATTGTLAGQSPETNPTFWNQLQIPYIFLQYCVYSAYADWLDVEGQSAKASSMRDYAQSFMDDENDRMERQQSNIQPWQVNTHVTSQNRGMGYQNQTFNAGTANIN